MLINVASLIALAIISIANALPANGIPAQSALVQYPVVQNPMPVNPMNQNPMAQDPLAQLRDIHLPDAISAWPPAPGWWIITAIVLALLVTGIYQWRRWRRRNRYRRQALQQLLVLQRYQQQPKDYLAYLQQLNQLLKQTALAANTDTDVAGLSGRQWLAFLDHSGNTSAFKTGIGKLLSQGPYWPHNASVNITANDIAELQNLARQWIKHHDVKRGGTAPC